MYPNLYYAFKDIFGADLPFLRFVNSFGFFVAIAFILAAIILVAELKRKSKSSLLQPTEIMVMVGRPATTSELLLNFLLGFLLGYKILGLFLLKNSASEDPQAFIFSTLGSWPAGIILGLFFAVLKWWDKYKHKLDKPEKRKVRIWPHDRVGEITIIALIFGLLGAKLFDIFENWGDFLKDPGSFIFSPAGLTFYGGLICAALAVWWYAKKNQIGFWHLNDAAAPALMLSYGVGRIGCQVSGDGDWGVYNSAYMVNEKGSISESTLTNFNQAIQQHTDFFSSHYNSIAEIPHKFFPKPSILSFLPDWFFAYNYPHNVNETGVSIADCTGKYCNQLPVPAFPTPLYEIIMCLGLFFLIWSLRKNFRIPGTLFSFYLILNGVERFFIEKIRVNVKMNFLGMQLSQAEVISALLIISGIGLWVALWQRGKNKNAG